MLLLGWRSPKGCFGVDCVEKYVEFEMARRSGFWSQIESSGEGMGILIRGRAGLGGEEDPGRGRRGEESKSGEWDPDMSEFPSDPRLSCLLEGDSWLIGPQRWEEGRCFFVAEKSRGWSGDDCWE